MHGRNVSDSWGESSLDRRDFRQDHGGGPEEIKGSPKKKANKWCKGKIGREHNFERQVYHTYWTGTGDARKEVNQYVMTCTKCGKRNWGGRIWNPTQKHKHDYSETVTQNYSSIAWMYEVCTFCGKYGDSIFIKK